MLETKAIDSRLILRPATRCSPSTSGSGFFDRARERLSPMLAARFNPTDALEASPRCLVKLALPVDTAPVL